ARGDAAAGAGPRDLPRHDGSARWRRGRSHALFCVGSDGPTDADRRAASVAVPLCGPCATGRMRGAMRVLGFDQQDVKLLGVFWSMSVRDKYMGSRLGRVWAVANPLLMLALFTFVFGFVFKMRVPGAETTFSYAIWLISGYGPWLATAEALMAASMSVVASAGLVKNMPFKTEILPVTASMTGLLPLGVCLGFLGVLLVVDGNTPSWHAVFGVVLVVVQFALVIALGFFTSVITVFVRDFS